MITHLLRFNQSTLHFELFSNAGDSHSPVLTSFCAGDLIIESEKQGINDVCLDVDVSNFPSIESLKSKSRALGRSIDRLHDKMTEDSSLQEKLSNLKDEHFQLFWLIDGLEAILNDSFSHHVATRRFYQFMNNFSSEFDCLIWMRNHKLSSHQLIWILEREPHILDDLDEFESQYNMIYNDVSMAWYGEEAYYD